jgi:YD repeat-containing protein
MELENGDRSVNTNAGTDEASSAFVEEVVEALGTIRKFIEDRVEDGILPFLEITCNDQTQNAGEHTNDSTDTTDTTADTTTSDTTDVDAGDEVQEVETTTGELITYGYDDEGNLEEVLQTDPNNEDGTVTSLKRGEDGDWMYTITEDGEVRSQGEATDVTADENGYSYTTSSGTYTQKADGTRVVEGADGWTNTYSYDDNGELKELRTSDGQPDGTIIYRRKEDGTWAEIDPETGESGRTIDTITANADGGYTLVNDELGATTTFHPDGSREEERQFEGVSITQEFNKDGQLWKSTREHYGTEETLVKDGDGWKLTVSDEQGNSVEGTNVQVAEDGSYTYEMQMGDQQVMVKQNSDGSRVEGTVDENGQMKPLTVRHPDGSIRYFNYDESGQLVDVVQTWPDSVGRRPETWRQSSPGQWHRDADGMPATDVSVNADGEFSYTYPGEEGPVVHVDEASGHYTDEPSYEDEVALSDEDEVAPDDEDEVALDDEDEDAPAA